MLPDIRSLSFRTNIGAWPTPDPDILSSILALYYKEFCHKTRDNVTRLAITVCAFYSNYASPVPCRDVAKLTVFSSLFFSEERRKIRTPAGSVQLSKVATIKERRTVPLATRFFLFLFFFFGQRPIVDVIRPGKSGRNRRDLHIVWVCVTQPAYDDAEGDDPRRRGTNRAATL